MLLHAYIRFWDWFESAAYMVVHFFFVMRGRRVLRSCVCVFDHGSALGGLAEIDDYDTVKDCRINGCPGEGTPTSVSGGGGKEFRGCCCECFLPTLETDGNLFFRSIVEIEGKQTQETTNPAHNEVACARNTCSVVPSCWRCTAKVVIAGGGEGMTQS